ncbi:hypothetical protein PGN35_023825 [Nodosilinea sp. PGN35]|uniref:hypothetical protein n=1 Tax=Nodosilinea sp. PGN35 TaxID=3020489 RepID=UPI0023B2D1E2|nr:hypothetical protein [Nodosilinea sp. TSF1-S3]MDF0370043.1 hypothetical protein [Nodosilinea sp. TSF1-S3]
MGLTESPDIDLAIAISHDCDIANDSLDAEPVIEFVLVRVIKQCNGNYTYGKNPRTLHLDYTHAGEPVFLELIASKKLTVQKDKLEAVQPDETYQLTPSKLQILQSWLAARYRRHALPNSLVDRLSAVFGYVEKKGKSHSSGILSFRLSYDPNNEIPPEEPYELWFNIVYVTDENEDRVKAEGFAHSLETEFPKLLEKTANSGTVTLRKCEAVSEMEFTLRDMRETFEYHLEHLSYRTEPSGPVI